MCVCGGREIEGRGKEGEGGEEGRRKKRGQGRKERGIEARTSSAMSTGV